MHGIVAVVAGPELMLVWVLESVLLGSVLSEKFRVVVVFYYRLRGSQASRKLVGLVSSKSV